MASCAKTAEISSRARYAQALHLNHLIFDEGFPASRASINRAKIRGKKDMPDKHVIHRRDANVELTRSGRHFSMCNAKTRFSATGKR